MGACSVSQFLSVNLWPGGVVVPSHPSRTTTYTPVMYCCGFSISPFTILVLILFTLSSPLRIFLTHPNRNFFVFAGFSKVIKCFSRILKNNENSWHNLLQILKTNVRFIVWVGLHRFSLKNIRGRM